MRSLKTHISLQSTSPRESVLTALRNIQVEKRENTLMRILVCEEFRSKIFDESIGESFEVEKTTSREFFD